MPLSGKVFTLEGTADSFSLAYLSIKADGAEESLRASTRERESLDLSTLPYRVSAIGNYIRKIGHP